MQSIDQSNVRSYLLAALAPADFALVGPYLERVTLPQGKVLIEAYAESDFLWFPEAGIVSQIASFAAGREVEVGLYGREGVGPIAPLLGAARGPHRHVVQADGVALRIATADMMRLMRQSAALQALLLRYVQAFTIQISFTAVSNASNLVGGRLARWLLMCHDRLDGQALAITHEFLGIMLSVRRSGVTDAIHILEGDRAIRATRGRIEVIDRQRLTRATGGTYGVPEDEYERLIGRRQRATRAVPDADPVEAA